LKNKYKVEKKVREHRRKVRSGSKLPMKLNKDPGIPNLWPFKEQLLQQAQNRKERLEGEVTRQKEARKKLKLENRRAAMGTHDQMADLASQAGRSAVDFEAGESKRAAEAPEENLLKTVKETSKKAFYKDFRKVIEQADVILEVLDARDPLGCRCASVEQAILKKDGRKKIILVLNKIDLVPREVVEKWRVYLKHEFPTVVFKSSTQSQKSHLRQANIAAADASDGLRESAECLGADALMKLLKNYSRIEDTKTSITVGVVGYPNVGKSSLINSLKREKVCKAGATAGTTRSTQEINLDTNIKLIDCPGIVFSNNDVDANIILRNCVDVRRLKDPFAPVELIRQRCKDAQLMALYEIPAFNDTTEFLAHIAVRKNKMRSGGTH
jgi:nuclear GTP-binding protein